MLIKYAAGWRAAAWELLPGATFTAVSAAIWISEGTYKKGWGKAETAEAEGLECPGAQEFEMRRFGNKIAPLRDSEPPPAFSFTYTEWGLWFRFDQSTVLMTERFSLRIAEDAGNSKGAKKTYSKSFWSGSSPFHAF